MQDRVFLVVSPPLLLVTPVLATMYHLSISPLSPGSIAMLAMIGLAGLSLGVVAAIASGRGKLGNAVAAASLAIVVLVFVDTVALGRTLLGSEISLPISILYIGVAVVALGFLFWLTRAFLPKVLFACSAAMFAFTLLVPTAQAQTSGPPLIYIVLDEMIGLGGIDLDLPGAAEAHAEMLGVLSSHGFLIYPNAYSRNYYSSRSIPAALNFDWNDDIAGNVSPYASEGNSNQFDRIALFDEMLSRGYSISVWQTGHMDFCAATEVECFEYPSFNPSSSYYEIPGGSFLATVQILQAAYKDTFILSFISRIIAYVASGGQFGTMPEFFDVHGFPQWFDHFRASLASTDKLRGRMVFAHFLMPHSPHILDPSCDVVRRVENPYELRERSGLQGAEFTRVRTESYKAYFEQVRCLARNLEALLTDLEQHPEYGDATIVLHGDHGSRISAGIHQEYLGESDIVDNYSTLFAIRAPGTPGGLTERQTSVQRLVAEYLGPIPTTSLGPDNNLVVIDSRTPGSSTVQQMPAIGTVE